MRMRLDDENLQNSKHREVLRREYFIKQVKSEAETEGAVRFGPEKQCEHMITKNETDI